LKVNWHPHGYFCEPNQIWQYEWIVRCINLYEYYHPSMINDSSASFYIFIKFITVFAILWYSLFSQTKSKLIHTTLLSSHNILPILHKLNIFLQIIHPPLHTPILGHHFQLLPLHPRFFITEVFALTAQESFGALGSGGSHGHFDWVFKGYLGGIFGVGGLAEDFSPVLAGYLKRGVCMCGYEYGYGYNGW